MSNYEFVKAFHNLNDPENTESGQRSNIFSSILQQLLTHTIWHPKVIKAILIIIHNLH